MLLKLKYLYLMVIPIVFGLLMNACSKGQIIVPKVTPEPTHLRLAGKFVWHDLLTSDLESTSIFYQGLFGWSFSDTASKEKQVKTISRNGVPIANAIYLDLQNRKVSESQWLSYISVEDVDDALMVSKKNNGTIYKQPKDLPNRGRVAIMKDPEGALFAILTTSGGDPPDQGFIQNHWMGSELWSKNPDTSLTFYRLLVGYEQRLVDVGAGPKSLFN